MAKTFFRRRTVVLLALVVIAIIAGKFGHPVYGFWDGPR